MSNQHKSFHPRLIITDHFDGMINHIDVITETLLVDKSFTEEKRNELNEMREKQIEKLKEIEKLNLSRLPQEIDEDEYRQKWLHILEDKSLDYYQKLDLIKKELILIDCILFEQPKNLINGLDLLVLSWYYDAENFDFLEYSAYLFIFLKTIICSRQKYQKY